MDNHGEYSPLDRSRLIATGREGGSGGSSGSSNAGGGGSHPQSVAELAARAATPTPLTTLAAQYHSRYGLPPAIPGSNYALMSSLLSGAHSSETRKALLPELQPYWSPHAENFPRYLMYPTYPPLFPNPAESLSLLGAGVACAASGATNSGAGPSQSHHAAHYQRLLEMQKEAYLAAAASHYRISASNLPFLEQTPSSSHGATPLSLVKQEPKELTCTEKAAKQAERRNMGFKVDLDFNRVSKETSLSASSSQSLPSGSAQNIQLKEPKLSPSSSVGPPNKYSNKKGGNPSTSGSDTVQVVKKPSNLTSGNSSSSSRHHQDNLRNKCTSPVTRATPGTSAPIPPKSTNNGSSNSSTNFKKSGTKKSSITQSTTKTSTSVVHQVSVTNSSKSPALSESSIVSVPTQAAAPIPLATVQHDGVVLSALASPSSAAASSVSTKPATIKQHADRATHPSQIDVGKSSQDANSSTARTPDRQIDTTLNCEDGRGVDIRIVSDRTDVVYPSKKNTIARGNLIGVTSNGGSDPESPADDSSDIVVDSTESEDIIVVDRSTSAAKSEHDRAIEETIERVASAADSDHEANQDDVSSQTCPKTSSESTVTTAIVSLARAETSCIVTSSGSSTGTRTVYAKTQPVPSVNATGGVQMTSTITTHATTSALPYYNTLYSKPKGVKKVHATTYVPEIGIFKGPSIKAMAKNSLSPSSSASSSVPSDARGRLDQRASFKNTNYNLTPDGASKGRDSTPSPSLLSPHRDSVLTSHYPRSSSTSPGTAHAAVEISSSLDTASLDSASIRSHSVASVHSGMGIEDSDEVSDDEGNSLIIDDDVNDNEVTVSVAENSDKVEHSPIQASVDEDNGSVGDLEINVDSVDDVEKDQGKGDNSDDAVIIISDISLPRRPADSLKKLDSKVPSSDVDDNACCDEAIDYSLPKASIVKSSSHMSTPSRNLPFRISNLSNSNQTSLKRGENVSLSSVLNTSNPHFVAVKETEQNPSKKTPGVFKSFPQSSIHNSAQTSKQIAPMKSLVRPEATKSTTRKSVVPATASHNRVKKDTGNSRSDIATLTSVHIRDKIKRRLHLQDVKPHSTRCGSAPPTAPATSSTATSPLSEDPPIETESREKCGASNDHSLGSIPVGIAVAQIRPHHIQKPRESQASERLTRNARQVRTTSSSKSVTQTTSSLAGPTTALPPNLVVAGHAVNPSAWLPQIPFSLHQAITSSGATFDSSHYPVAAPPPSGFKFAQDSLTGQIFLVPNGDFVEQGGVWPPANFASPTGAGHTHFQSAIPLPSITVNSPEDRDGRSKPETSLENGASHEKPSDKIIPSSEILSKDRPCLAREVGKQHAIAQPIIGSSSLISSAHSSTTATVATLLVNPVVTSAASSSPSVDVKAERPAVQSRGCSPIIFDDASSSLSILSTLSSLRSRRPTTCTIGVQTSESSLRQGRKRKQNAKSSLHDQGVQTTSHDPAKLNPLSVHCPDLDPVEHLEVKSNPERPTYNPFTDPQILQAADGLELLSTLAEKRPKCSSLDDPKRIFPSPSDSFKSDSASIVAMEDALSPGETELKSGQCTPRRDMRRDLSPKWALPKKEPPALTFGDFKTPPEIDIMDALEVRVRLAEVQRQYKEKQKELAKLQIKKTEEGKPAKRGPGRPPKKKTPPAKKSDDDSSSSSSKTKEHHHQHKKKRPAEELVDRVFRKLPPVKPSKVSRSIHYVKSKTGPFFKRKSASSSVKKNKDLFGFDESNWPSYSERKHQEKIKGGEFVTSKGKHRHRSNSSHSDDGKHGHDAGNIFSNLESFTGEHVERRGRPPKNRLQKDAKHSSVTSSSVTVKTEPSHTSSHPESGLGLLAKFALTTSPSSLSSTAAPSTLSSTSLMASSLATTTASSISVTTVQNSNTFSCGIYGSGLCISGSSYSMSSSSTGGHVPSLTFGSMSSFMSSVNSGLMTFSGTCIGAANLPSNSNTSATTAPTTSACTVSVLSSSTPKAATTGTVTVSTSSSVSAHQQPEEQSSGVPDKSTGSTDVSNGKRKHDEDSDTDTSETSPNKKRKPGRPRKINPDKSSGGTETIWAKKSNTMGLLQASESQNKDGDGKKQLDPDKPVFLDEWTEWTRRRSERIFLNDTSPQPSPALSPVPSGEPVWKLSHFMPKSKKSLDTPKSSKDDNTSKSGKDDGDTDTEKARKSKDSSRERPSSSSSTPIKVGTSTPSSSVSSSSMTVKNEDKESTQPSSMWPTSSKSVEISVVKNEDAKKIVRREEISSPPSLSTSRSSPLSVSPEKGKKSLKEKDPNKMKKKKKKKKKSESDEASSPIRTSSPPPPTLVKKEERAQENSKIKLQKAKSLHDLTQRVKKKFSKAAAKKQEEQPNKKKGKRGRKKRKLSSDSSDNDNLPLSSYRDGPPTPEPRSCKLQTTDLRESLKVLYLNDGLFYEGTVKALQPPDVYGVLTAGQRGSRPHILCQEEVLKDAVLDVRPGSSRWLPEGTRVCAFWSQQFSCLYPGTVAKSSISHQGKAPASVSVDFDDGDSGRIPIDHIRLLPSDFPIVEYEPDPLENLPKRRRRTTSDASDLRQSADSKSNKRKKKRNDEEEDDNDDEEEEEEDDDDDTKDDSDSDDDEDVRAKSGKFWSFVGKGTKRPGLKGKAKKSFYKAIVRGKETINVGDSAVFVSTTRTHCPYIGRIKCLWKAYSGRMMVKVCWFYHPQEAVSNKKLSDTKNALFESVHEDDNDVQTISHKCEVLPLAQYRKKMSEATRRGQTPPPNSVFYVAGFYNPSAKAITFEPGVS